MCDFLGVVFVRTFAVIFVSDGVCFFKEKKKEKKRKKEKKVGVIGCINPIKHASLSHCCIQPPGPDPNRITLCLCMGAWGGGVGGDGGGGRRAYYT